MQTIALECPNGALAEVLLEKLREELQPLKQFVSAADNIYLTRKQAAEILDVCPHTVNNYIRYGMIQPHYPEGCAYAKYKLGEILALRVSLPK